MSEDTGRRNCKNRGGWKTRSRKCRLLEKQLVDRLNANEVSHEIDATTCDAQKAGFYLKTASNTLKWTAKKPSPPLTWNAQPDQLLQSLTHKVSDVGATSKKWPSHSSTKLHSRTNVKLSTTTTINDLRIQSQDLKVRSSLSS